MTRTFAVGCNENLAKRAGPIATVSFDNNNFSAHRHLRILANALLEIVKGLPHFLFGQRSLR